MTAGAERVRNIAAAAPISNQVKLCWPRKNMMNVMGAAYRAYGATDVECHERAVALRILYWWILPWPLSNPPLY